MQKQPDHWILHDKGDKCPANYYDIVEIRRKMKDNSKTIGVAGRFNWCRLSNHGIRGVSADIIAWRKVGLHKPWGEDEDS